MAVQWREDPGRTLGGVTQIQRGRPVHSGDRLFGSATARTRSTYAARPAANPNTPRDLGPPAPAPARRSRQCGAPHRTNDVDGDKHRRTRWCRHRTAFFDTEGSRYEVARYGVAARWPSPLDDWGPEFSVRRGGPGAAAKPDNRPLDGMP